MTRRIALFTLVAILWIAQTSLAQAPYQVKEGDTLYALKGIYSANQPEWKALTIVNPQLAEPGRAFTDTQKRFIVILRLGERLKGLEMLGITAQPILVTGFVAPAPTTKNVVTDITASADSHNRWLIALMATVLALIIPYLIFRYLPESRRPNLPFLGRYNPALTTNPVTAAPPMVAGGIASDNHDAIRRQFREQAARTYASTHGGVIPQMSDIRIVGNIIHGTLHDVWETSDANGRWIPRRYNGEPGFQAMVSVNNAEPALQTWSQPCGNDLRIGRRYRGGRFISRPAAGTIPAQAPATPVAPLRPHIAVAQEPDGQVVTITVGGMRYTTHGNDIHVNVDQGGAVTDVTANGQIRVAKVPKRTKPRVVRPAATGTRDK
ncbi:MAG: hypothetical protein Q7R69_03550 [bacterium]|nr:hypothetical protein [bacterium]